MIFIQPKWRFHVTLTTLHIQKDMHNEWLHPIFISKHSLVWFIHKFVWSTHYLEYLGYIRKIHLNPWFVDDANWYLTLIFTQCNWPHQHWCSQIFKCWISHLNIATHNIEQKNPFTQYVWGVHFLQGAGCGVTNLRGVGYQICRVQGD